mmetsp:Transcript_44685/g.82784  ORF Transcript_44685/g.82784 Transcript_44685/m.82784 type:complete len:113 (-) Transcript_44685:466-804(-)
MLCAHKDRLLPWEHKRADRDGSVGGRRGSSDEIRVTGASAGCAALFGRQKGNDDDDDDDGSDDANAAAACAAACVLLLGNPTSTSAFASTRPVGVASKLTKRSHLGSGVLAY